MGRSSWALAVLVAIATSALGTASIGCRKSLANVPFTWERDPAAGFARARAERKPIVLYFGASWDCAAKELEHQTWSDPAIRLLLARDFVAIAVDATDDEDPFTRAMQERFKVVGDPTVIILRSDGRSEIRRFYEYVPPDVMGGVLRAATRPRARGLFRTLASPEGPTW